MTRNTISRTLARLGTAAAALGLLAPAGFA